MVKKGNSVLLPVAPHSGKSDSRPSPSSTNKRVQLAISQTQMLTVRFKHRTEYYFIETNHPPKGGYCQVTPCYGPKYIPAKKPFTPRQLLEFFRERAQHVEIKHDNGIVEVEE